MEGIIEKSKKVYLGKDEKPPKGVVVVVGPRKGRYYEPKEEGKQEETKTGGSTPGIIQTLALEFKKAGHKLYEVGGSLRDELLGRQSSDSDFTTDATPDKTKEILSNSGLGSVFTIGEEYGTIGLNTKQGDKIEITTFRGEVYPTSSRKPKVTYGTDLKEDLARRDFTFNAMARDVLTGDLIDPFGGQEDLKAGRIRTVGNAKDRFAEDPLRMLRAVRFASQLGFDKVDVEMPETDKLQNISKERISSELNKILISPHPAKGVELLKRFGLMKYIVPEFEALYNLQQNKMHHKDAYGHTLEVIDRASKFNHEGKDKLVLMLAAMLHDIAKPNTKTGSGDEVHFLRHEDIGSKMTKEILANLNYDNDTIDRASTLVQNHMRPLLTEPSSKVVNRLVKDIGKHEAELLIDLVEADAKSTISRSDDKLAGNLNRYREMLSAEFLPEKKMGSPINGEEIMAHFSLPAGRVLGEIKGHLTDKVIDGELDPDDKEKAFAMAKKFIEEKGINKSIEGIIKQAGEEAPPKKVYIKAGQHAPKGQQSYRGAKGGFYYLTGQQDEKELEERASAGKQQVEAAPNEEKLQENNMGEKEKVQNQKLLEQAIATKKRGDEQPTHIEQKLDTSINSASGDGVIRSPKGKYKIEPVKGIIEKAKAVEVVGNKEEQLKPLGKIYNVKVYGTNNKMKEGYIGMNKPASEAVKVKTNIDNDEIIVSKNKPSTMKNTIKHEVVENDLMNKKKMPYKEAHEIALESEGGDMKKGMELSPEEEIAIGMKEELEHKDITGGDPETTRKIVNAHLKEDPHYYSKLIQVGLIKKQEGENKDASKDGIKRRLLGDIHHFLQKYEENELNKSDKQALTDVKKAIESLSLYKTSCEQNNTLENVNSTLCEREVDVFLKGYETLAYLGNDLSDERLWTIFTKAIDINDEKHFGISMDNSDRIGRIISVDAVAHALHQNKNSDGSSQYEILDELAGISKSLGEKDRSTRLLVLQDPSNVAEIEKLLKLEVLQKGELEKSGKFWRLFEKAIRFGLSKLSNFELIALREWIYAKI